MSNKLNITPGPWTQIGWDIKFKTELTIANSLVLADAEAIVTAVNNTYHKGINPEAVPEMLEVLKEYISFIEETIPFHEESIIYKKAVSALQKATL